MKKLFPKFIGGPINVDLKEAPIKSDTCRSHHRVSMVICNIYPLRIIISIITVLHIEIVVMELEVCMALLVVAMDSILFLPVMDMLIIIMHLGVLMVFL